MTLSINTEETLEFDFTFAHAESTKIYFIFKKSFSTYSECHLIQFLRECIITTYNFSVEGSLHAQQIVLFQLLEH